LLVDIGEIGDDKCGREWSHKEVAAMTTLFLFSHAYGRPVLIEVKTNFGNAIQVVAEV
jgi:hypothetical protein